MSRSQVPHSRPLHEDQDIEAASAVLRSQMSASGRRARQLAERLNVAFDGESASTTPSGTLALVTALAAFDIGAGDEVIIPTYVCPEVLDAIHYVGARPILADIDPATYTLSRATVKAVVRPRCRAVVVPHMFGIPAAVDEIQQLGLPTIEDLAQGLGARLKGRRAGAWGDACVLSFKAIKMISAGEGGAVVIRDRHAARRLARLRERREAGRPAFDFPMSDVAASIAATQWRRLPEFVRRRRHLARRYRAGLSELSSKGAVLPGDRPGCAWFRFPITIGRPMTPLGVRAALARKGIQVRRPVDVLLHRSFALPAPRFPAAERVFASTVSLPLYPALTEADQDRVIDAFRRVVEQGTSR